MCIPSLTQHTQTCTLVHTHAHICVQIVRWRRFMYAQTLYWINSYKQTIVYSGNTHIVTSSALFGSYWISVWKENTHLSSVILSLCELFVPFSPSPSLSLPPFFLCPLSPHLISQSIPACFLFFLICGFHSRYSLSPCLASILLSLYLPRSPPPISSPESFWNTSYFKVPHFLSLSNSTHHLFRALIGSTPFSPRPTFLTSSF